MKIQNKTKQTSNFETPEEIYKADIIEKSYHDASLIIPANIRSLVAQKQKFIEDKVYLSLSDKGNNIL